MTSFNTLSEEEIQRINQLQRISFDKLYQLFEPPLPEVVPERLEKIVANGNIAKGDTVLDVGSGTGILIPIIKKYKPGSIYACDLSRRMLEQLKKNYPYVKTIMADVRDLKAVAFSNISRMMKAKGRIVISHPLGKAFILSLKKDAPFPLDEFPEEPEAGALLKPFGFEIETFIDEPMLYILVAIKCRFKSAVDKVE
jgi:SAM-dependent methyltransferase